MTIRILIVATLSMASGAAAMLSWVRSSEPSISSALEAASARPGPGAQVASSGAASASRRGQSRLARRAAAYRRAANTDGTTLGRAIDELEDQPAETERGLLLEALLLRATELDPEAALARLADSPLDRRQATAVAFALVEVLGSDADAIERVAAALPRTAARSFRTDAFADWARRAPERALQAALALDDTPLRSEILQAVGAAWAEVDPAGALAEVRMLQAHGTQAVFRPAVLRQLIEASPEAAASYFDELRIEPGLQGAMMRAIADSVQFLDPAAAMELADRLSGQPRDMARGLVVQHWAQTDPVSAAAFAEALPAGRERQELLQAAGRGYGRQDPEAALAWAAGLQHAPPGIRVSVLSGVAQADPGRAFDLIFDGDLAAPGRGPGAMGAMFSLVQSAMSSPDIEVGDIANRMLSLDPNVQRTSMPLLFDIWARSEPRESLNWVASNVGRIETNALSRIVNNVAQQDPIAAAQYTARISPELRDAWITAVAQGYAQVDPRGARDWLAQFRGEPAYTDGVAAIVQHTAQYDAPAAAELLRTVDARSPQAAQAALNVGTIWMQQDPQAARLWVLGMPEGAMRDAALRAYVAGSTGERMPDPGILALFGSDRERQEALLSVIFKVGQRDPVEARSLIERHLTDLEIRRRAEQWVDRAPQGGVGIRSGTSVSVIRGF